MIASLPDLSIPTGWPCGAGAMPQAAKVPEATGLDFAGLLGAVFAPPVPPADAAQMPSALPDGTILPDEGASLSQAMLATVPVEVAPAPAYATASVAATTRPARQDDAGQADPAAAEALRDHLPDEPTVPADSATNAAVTPSFAPSLQPQGERAATPAPTADPALLTALVSPQLALAATPPVLTSVRPQRIAPQPTSDRAHAPIPARAAWPPAAGTRSSTEDGTEIEAVQPTAPLLTLPPAADSAPPSAQPVAPLAAAPAAPLPTPGLERIEAARAPAPQQESAIAQIGDLREALRSARPDITLRHAEFGMVSVRIEAATPDQWRAVLASRDPGFVPAIQVALAERALAPSADAAASFLGQSGAGQQGADSHRYGASPNGGQGGLSPYLGQSGGRDGEAAPDRRPSTAAALAAREGERDKGKGRAAATSGGLFA